MELDFSLSKLRRLYSTILSNNYEVITFSDYLQGKFRNKAVILRHDVDRLVKNALKIATLEQEIGIRSSYYFRYRKGIFNTRIIKEISDLGHEIGYHYEVLAKTRGDLGKGIELFMKELEKFREIVTIKTICVHGSPLSRWDSRKLWGKYSYKDLALQGEPYFEVDYSQVAYITDTGRRWNSSRFSLRDKVKTPFKFNFRNTDEIIYAFKNNKFPGIIMINIHPNRWHKNKFLWTKELVVQNLKNMIKRFMIRNTYRDQKISG